jgi:uncharacterized small protein (DUF1192 family)
MIILILVRTNTAWEAWQAAQADKLDLLNALKAALDWIDAVPSETVLPKPDPSIWMRPDELQKVKVSPYLCHGWNERDKQSDAIPLYTYPPDAQAEIDRLKSENTEMARLLSTRVEAVRLDEKQDEIDRLKAELETLRASRHYELVQAAGIARNEDLEDEQVAYMVEKERENADRRRDVYP